MRRFKLVLELASSLLTPFQSDTLFGHLCWAIYFSAGADRLTRFLDDYRQSPPLLLTAAFPEGFLPSPVLPPLTRNEFQQLAHERYPEEHYSEKDRIRRVFQDLKRIKRRRLVPLNDWSTLARHLSPLELTRTLLQTHAPRSAPHMVTRTAVDRLTNTARTGQLYEHEEVFYEDAPDLQRFALWIDLDDQRVGVSEAFEWFRMLEVTGYGKRKSAGAGRVQMITTFDEFANDDHTLPPDAGDSNAFVTLSSFVPRHDDPVPGAYYLMIKRGKLGGAWATRDDVWKKPLMMFGPGSLFMTQASSQPPYGRLVENLSAASAQVVQYGYAFPVGVHVESRRGEVNE